MPENDGQVKKTKYVLVLAVSAGSLDLPERPKLPERPPKYRKYQRIIEN